MILVDTSVLVDCLRSTDAKLLSLLQAENAVICGVVRAEILRGTRDTAHRKKLTQFLDALPQVGFPRPLWDALGDNLAELRRNGVTVPLPDAALATLAIVLDIEIWSRDHHFAVIQSVIPSLRLFQEPP